jgi:nitronate monooxygenase
MDHNFKPLIIRGKTLLPVIQGGMGVGISAQSLAGTVASEGAVGTIASVDLRHLHEDLVMPYPQKGGAEELNRLNMIALDREVKGALARANGQGLVSVNVMKAVDAFPDMIRQACESGAQAVTMGAGLPLELPDLVKEHPHVALFPILSESRGIAIVLKRWMKKNVLPDAIVIEHPNHAAGHLGAATVANLGDERFTFSRVINETRQLFKELEIESHNIPIILAGGMSRFSKIQTAFNQWGADGIQVGTAFAVTAEGDAHENFKKVLRDAKEEDIVEFMSVAGLPARGVLTPWLKSYLSRLEKLQANAKNDTRRCVESLNCLTTCGLRDGISKIGQFCIDKRLAQAWRGETKEGLFFRGKDPLPFGDQMRTAKETLAYLLMGLKPEGV